ncbi:hypothetical protein ACEWY4_021998 [Coilia grayii]|uniref:Pro-opiomelanocortin/corticotropin ACTH central region domain-containing protein n=1 Tax=Coilia grayii TaxID=363190 RepID=A0ABD1J6K7_9TELE
MLQLMGVCVMVGCLCVCVNASGVSLSCSEEQLCTDRNPEEAILNCAPEPGQGTTPSSKPHLAPHPAPPRVRRGADTEDEDGGDEDGVFDEEEGGGSVKLLKLLMSMPAPPTPTHTEDARSAERRGYSMEHFRWGKPKGKRRPIKVFVGVAPEARPGFAVESRRGLTLLEEEEPVEEGVELLAPPTRPTDRLRRFRWSPAPVPAHKRYGGFMKPWPASTPSHKLLLTLLRHVIAKDAQ